MSSMLEQLWPIFLGEVSEQLDAVEAMVIASSGDSTDIDALFREFHTIKSSFSMVDFKVPMELAHACEDVLHGLRRSNATPDANIRKYLLEAVDWIKQQLAIASPGNYPQHTNDQLLENLSPFRFVSDESDTQTTIPAVANINGKKESAAEKITEEKEALAVDTLRIYSQSLDNLLTYVNNLVTQGNEQSKIVEDKSLVHTVMEVRKTIQKIKSGEHADIANIKKAFLKVSTYRQRLLQTDTSIRTAVTSIQREVLDLRIIPLSTIFNKLPRIVRQKASAAGKQVQLIIEGGDVMIDKGMVEIISEPLIHLLHNAIIHGIEPAEDRLQCNKPALSQISILASEQGNMLRIEVVDDGKGIDYLAVRNKAIHKGFAKENDENTNPTYWLNFLFLHGLNSENINRVTGLDIVKEQLSNIGGTIDISSKPGSGTRFIMRMPVTVAIQSVILALSRQQTFAFPARHVLEITEVPYEKIESHEGQPSINLRNNILPVYALEKILNLKETIEKSNKLKYVTLLILRSENNCIAISIDDVIGRRELFLREIHPDIRKIPGINGVSLLGNGNPVIILDSESIFKITKNSNHYIERSYEN